MAARLDDARSAWFGRGPEGGDGSDDRQTDDQRSGGVIGKKASGRDDESDRRQEIGGTGIMSAESTIVNRLDEPAIRKLGPVLFARQYMLGWLQLLTEPGQIVELRALKVKTSWGRPQTQSGYFEYAHLESMAINAAQLSTKASGIYFTLNHLDPGLLARRCNRVGVADDNQLTSDKDIIKRRWLLVDADPVRAAGISSTDAEKAKSLETSLDVKEYLHEIGWPLPILSDSGNGYHLLYRIDLPADDKGNVKRILHALAARFNNDAVKIDTTVHNPARICKLPGTMTCKGDSTKDRPHRRSWIMEIPGS